MDKVQSSIFDFTTVLYKLITRMPIQQETMQQYETEFILKGSSKILYNHLSTASGLQEWFADEVVIDREGVYTFKWDGSEEQFTLKGKKRDEYIRFDRLDEDTFIEFRIQVHAMTKSTALVITAFCEPGEEQAEIDLWESLVNDLKQKIGG